MHTTAHTKTWKHSKFVQSTDNVQILGSDTRLSTVHVARMRDGLELSSWNKFDVRLNLMPLPELTTKLLQRGVFPPRISFDEHLSRLL